jgi:hypothetical protein
MTRYDIDRRSFIKSATALSAMSLFPLGCATVTPQELIYNARTKKPATVRGAFFYPPLDVVLEGKCEDKWSKNKWCTWPGNQCELEKQQAKFMDRITSMTADLNLKLSINEKSIHTTAGMNAFRQDIEKTKPDALLIFNFWNSFKKKFTPLIDQFDGPIIFYHPVGANHQLPPEKLQVSPKVQYIHSIENWAALERGFRSIHAFNTMRQSRLLRIDNQDNKLYKEEFFGTDICQASGNEFNKLFDETKMTPGMEKTARRIRSKAKKIMDLKEKAFSDGLRAHAAVLEMLRRYDADAITIKCLMLKHRKPCLSFGINNGNLIPCGCENDYNATLSLMLGSNLFGRGGFQHNPEFDTEENLYFASHCTCTTKLHGPEGRETPYLLRPFFHQLPKSLALDVLWPEGEPATLFKYNSKEKNLHAWGGEVVSSPTCPPTGGCATRVLVKMHDVKDIRTVYPGPHPILYCGDFLRQAKAFSDLYELPINCNA